MFETRDTRGVRVVDQSSADAGHGVPRAIDADHFSICKPGLRTELVYGTVRNFLGRRLPQPPPSRHSPRRLSEGSRFFISYSRRSAADGSSPTTFAPGSRIAGHEVFIDVGMRVGTDWVAEIEQRVDWCDFVVVLLSERSIHSEMVLGEVRRAHRKRRKDGRPRILPLRVHYDGPLDYELDSYLGRVQYIRWDGAADTSHVLGEIVAAAAPDLLHQGGLAIACRPPPVGRPPAGPSRARMCARSRRPAARSGSAMRSMSAGALTRWSKTRRNGLVKQLLSRHHVSLGSPVC